MITSFITKVFADTEANYKIFNSNPTAPSDFAGIICTVVKIVLDFIPFLFVLAAVAFVQGLVKYVAHGDNEEKRSEGQKMMIYGILGFFFMVSIWGILKLFTNSFGLDAVIPQFNGKSFTSVCS